MALFGERLRGGAVVVLPGSARLGEEPSHVCSFPIAISSQVGEAWIEPCPKCIVLSA
jgi:hypothetical protein